MSNIIDILLQPFSEKIPSYVRDDLDVLSNIPQEVNENILLVSFDVTSLYSNKPHNLGTDAIKYWFATEAIGKELLFLDIPITKSGKNITDLFFTNVLALNPIFTSKVSTEDMSQHTFLST